ncbi:hypothetical protein GOP47_0002935 [Adiantum capillus-veneris]|uniref:Fe2OG dioxygenase domain-containing protein n=1 Tax=Adiantum capillus-veneris TaxID=13818 RepID=A0A9D4VBJ9_ADICA|nr:hypothetical protein GOP47_0002935 [Adiantum capillus-veneris]
MGDRRAAGSGEGSSGGSGSVGEVLACVEEWLPPAIRSASSSDKAKLFQSIASLYQQQDQHRLHAHLRYRQLVQSQYKALHPELFVFRADRFFVPTFEQMLHDGSEVAVRRTMCAHGPLLYSFDMLRPQFCTLLLQEVQHFEKWLEQSNMQKSPPNSLSSAGVVLDDIGLNPILQMLMQQCVAPLVPVLFPQLGDAPLDSHHGYVVTHSANLDPSISCHIDNSEVTLNVSLCKAEEGGELYFKGVRCVQHLDDPERDLEMAEYKHVPGRALLHLGKHRHGARPVLKGKRANLVLWCRSSKFRANTPAIFVCPPWCNATNKQKVVVK